MGETEDNYIKILFRFHNELWAGMDVETMWATLIDKEKGLYKIDNIPFYAPLVASDDIVFAEYDESEKMLCYRKTVEHSGNSIVQVFLMNKKYDIAQIRDIFKNLGCISEGVNDTFFSMEIPFGISYWPVKQKLKGLELEKIIAYAEPCLSQKHSSLQP